MPPQQPAVASRLRSFETMSSWALIATFIVVLFIFIPSASVPFVATKTFALAIGALITLAFYILARLSRGNIIFPPLALVGALWLPAIGYALSSAFSGVPFMNALWGGALEPDTLGFMLVATVLGTLTALVLRRPEQYRSFLSTSFLVFSALVVLEALVVIIGQFAPNFVSPAFSFIGSFEDLAFLLGLGVIGILITLRFLELPRRAYRALLLSGAVALALLAIANSSFVWMLVALVALGLFVEAAMRRRPETVDSDLDEAVVMTEMPAETRSGTHSIVLPLSVLAVSLFFLVGGTLGNALANTLQVNVLSVRPSWQSTLSVAQNAYTTAPVFGTGPGTFGIEWLKYRDAALNSTVFWNVDFSSGIGFIPTSFVTTGLVGAFAWIAFLALLIVLGLRMLIMRAPEDAFIRYVGILSFVATLYLFAIAIFALPSAILVALAFCFAGLFVSSTRFASGSKQWGIMFSRSPRLGFVIVFSLTLLLLASVVAAYSLVEHYIAATDLTKAETALAAGNLDAADQAAQDSIAFAPSASAYQIAASIATGRLGQIAASSTMSKTAAQQAFQTALSAGINAALTAVRLAPSDYQNWIVLGNLYAQAVPLKVSGAYDSAKTAYEKAEKLNPTNPQILYVLAQLDIANNDIKAAQADLVAAIALKQDYTAAIFLLSQLEVQSGNVKDALTAALAAAYFTPNNPNILFQVGILSAAEGDYAGAAAALSAAVNANPQFANARYFLAAVYAKQGDMQNALAQIKAIAALSADNAQAVASQTASLEAGKNPFPANLLSASSTPVK
ncbi:tetratricopeptide repeat protein [Patescibacteria group bacterium]|nr:tetratricopeptide repeat protein [Patescibacteria group bacterium]MDE2021638.1 tetratricopeptide repeat protein [Patescibacteria group bacterium]MDE2173123.1 tetratricopeptide repeat protein [Patescibacteria group bacterium]